MYDLQNTLAINHRRTTRRKICHNKHKANRVIGKFKLLIIVLLLSPI